MQECLESKAQMQQVVGEISVILTQKIEASMEIHKIMELTKDIISISDKTRMLALNANIEAARAGEQGKGFAVVADQIGKLATDSAQSAVTTRELISKSLDEIKVGNKIVENTMEAISTVLEDMQSFADMASAAAASSREQADLLKQIEGGIDQISSVVQSNSASAEQTSAVSEELSSQALGLENMVERFVLK
jgi:methyl-accepting chemotaxis protein